MRTIIVGAGIAGLWLADQLKSPHNEIIVLEQSNYVGGRIVTSAHGYEIGAGRISTDHKRVMDLIARFKLQTYPHSPGGLWKGLADTEITPNTFQHAWKPIIAVLEMIRSDIQATNTLRSLATKILGARFTNSVIEQFGYRAEMDTLRADLGICAFKHEMGSESFVGVTGGLSQLVKALAIGTDIRLDTTVQNVSCTGDIYYVKTPKKTFECDRVILALPVNALRKLPCMATFKTMDHLRMEPLTRIYAQLATPLPPYLSKRLVTDSPLRYIIPIRPAEGIIMISYIESQDTRRWKGLHGYELIAALQKELLRLFNETPKFKWARAYEWDDGCTYWLPGTYDPAVESQKALQPFPNMPHLHLCNESFSLRQAWIEGSLEHAAALIKMLNRTMS